MSQTIDKVANNDKGAAVRKIAILGAGVMGTGLAQAFGEAAYRVTVIDNSEAALSRCRKDVENNYRLQRLFGKGSATLGEALNYLEFTSSCDALGGVEAIIENVTEIWEVKKKLHEAIRELYQSGTLVAINTSVIPITRLANVTKEPQFTVGMHFMNPVPLSAAVEVIRGYHSSAEAVERAVGLAQVIGKEAIIVNDFPGFVTNRVLMLTLNEAIWTVQDQVAEPREVDRIFKLCFGHKMGPIETADLIGLDTVLLSLHELYNNYHDSKFRPCPLLQKMVDAGLCGRKSGRGFYDYSS
jgi:3-hydroxybutyryl-CoA dehydrogenase